jgi:hypothetical protein
MHESCWGVNTDSEGQFLSFPTPTHTYVSDAHSYSYVHFGTAACGVSGLLEIGFTNKLETLGMVTDSVKVMTFKLVIKLN